MATREPFFCRSCSWFGVPILLFRRSFYESARTLKGGREAHEMVAGPRGPIQVIRAVTPMVPRGQAPWREQVWGPRGRPASTARSETSAASQVQHTRPLSDRVGAR